MFCSLNFVLVYSLLLTGDLLIYGLWTSPWLVVRVAINQGKADDPVHDIRWSLDHTRLVTVNKLVSGQREQKFSHQSQCCTLLASGQSSKNNVFVMRKKSRLRNLRWKTTSVSHKHNKWNSIETRLNMVVYSWVETKQKSTMSSD